MLTKNDFVVIAAVIRNRADMAVRNPDELSRNTKLVELWAIYLDLAIQFKENNPRFQRPVFYDACFSPAVKEIISDLRHASYLREDVR